MARYTIEVLDDIERYLWESGRRKGLSAADAQVYVIRCSYVGRRVCYHGGSSQVDGVAGDGIAGDSGEWQGHQIDGKIMGNRSS